MNNLLTRYIRIWLLLAVAGGSLMPVSAQEPALPETGTDSAAIMPALRVNGIAGVIVRDLSDGHDVVSQNPGLSMTPASTLKCLTSAAALLDDAAPGFYETSAIIDGPLDKDGNLWGNLILKTSGDPTIESEYFPQNHGLADSIATRLAASGVKSIKGSVVIDTSTVPEGGPVGSWTSDDRRWYYGAGHYALNYRDNTVKPDKALVDPPGAFYDDLVGCLEKSGMVVEDQELSPGNARQTIYRRLSPPMTDIMHSMMVRSDNMFAEGVLRSLAPGKGLDAAIECEKQILAKLNVPAADYTVFDGSGLTRQNAITPAALALTLEKMLHTPKASTYVGLFPKAGVEGTVRRFLKDTPLEGSLLLKSGSVSGVQCYAGYKIDNQGEPTHVVVVMVNKFSGRRGAVVDSVTEFLNEVFSTNTDQNYE